MSAFVAATAVPTHTSPASVSSRTPRRRATVRMTETAGGQSTSRRAFLLSALAAGAAVTAELSSPVVPALADQSSLTGDYPQDAAIVLASMKEACGLTRGAPGMADTVRRTRQDMNDFVALYRRNNKVAGTTSFSTLYTAINTLSGHYVSYGNAYPVPEKRKKRLNQQFNEVTRALSRGR